MADTFLQVHAGDMAHMSTRLGVRLFEGEVAECKALHGKLHLDITYLFKLVSSQRGLFGERLVFFCSSRFLHLGLGSTVGIITSGWFIGFP
jgi:hypothetical protein